MDEYYADFTQKFRTTESSRSKKMTASYHNRPIAGVVARTEGRSIPHQQQPSWKILLQNQGADERRHRISLGIVGTQRKSSWIIVNTLCDIADICSKTEAFKHKRNLLEQKRSMKRSHLESILCSNAPQHGHLCPYADDGFELFLIMK